MKPSIVPSLLVLLLGSSAVYASSNHPSASASTPTNKQSSLRQPSRPSAAVKDGQSSNTRSLVDIDTRIVGGTLSKTVYPFFGLWEVGCGVSLIHDDLALTAAHCNLGDMFARRVYFGDLELEQGVQRNIISLFPHPNYDQISNSWDYMIVKLNASAVQEYSFDEGATAVARTKSILKATPTGLKPVAINRNDNLPQTGDSMTIMGFGLTEETGFGLNQNLYETTVLAVSDTDCEDAYHSLFVPEVMMCAGDPNGGRDSCQGDSGGPMIDDATGVQIGIVSWGEGCGEKSHPGVYSKVSAIADWIDEQICQNSCYPPDSCDPTQVHPCSLAPPGTSSEGGSLEGAVSVTLTITMDTYPSEVAAIFAHVDTETELWYMGYGSFKDADSPITDPLVITQTISNLPAGVYHFMVGDKSLDGLCCSYGNGSISIRSDLTGEDIWVSNGNYGGSAEVYMNLKADGQVEWVANNPDGTVTDGWGEDESYESTTQDGGGQEETWPVGFTGVFNPEQDDPEWPGEYPSPVGSKNVIVFNMRTDSYPEENTWSWSIRKGPEEWQRVDEGTPLLADTIVSYTHDLVSDAIYRMTINDRFSDGTCCLYSQGWFSITNATATEENDSGTVMWTKDGDFDSVLEIYLWVDPDGHAQVVEYIPGEGYALIQYEIVSAERTIVVEESATSSTSETRSSINRNDIWDP